MPTALDVLFPLPLSPLRFLAPLDRPLGAVGSRVAVPWQGAIRIGLVTAIDEIPAGKSLDYKEAVDWLDSRPFVHPSGVTLVAELAERTATPPGVILGSLAPIGFRELLVHEIMLLAPFPDLELAPERWLEADHLDAVTLDVVRRQGLIVERARFAVRTERRLVGVRPADGDLAGSNRATQRQALALLASVPSGFPSAAALSREADVSVSAGRALVTKGYAAYRDLPAGPPTIEAPAAPHSSVEPHGGVLAHAAVTSLSGGRRVDRLAALIRTLQRDLAAGTGVLVLAPERPVLEEAASVLMEHVPLSVLRAETPDDVRNEVWEQIRNGPPRVLVGTFLALLAPFEQLGRVVVLEASNRSFKMLSGARLFVPDVARRLARIRDAPAVLCDVVASPETTSLADLVEVTLPRARQRIHVADLGGTANWPLGSDLMRVLKQVAERSRQALILAPRRGFSAALGCPDCGYAAGCPNCDLALRYHHTERRLRCHQCGHEELPPERCPDCAQERLGPLRGPGTQWIAQAVRDMLPSLTVLRYDSDRRDDLTPLRAGEPGVLVGTTSVLRLPPFTKLSLIAVALLDTHMNVSDFRADEETLRLVLSLPELAGGPVPLTLLQTFQPDHPVVTALAAPVGAGVDRYLADILERRRQFRYPPFSHLAKIQISAREAPVAQRAAQEVIERLSTAGATSDEVLGPAPAPVARVRGRYTYHVLVRSDSATAFQRLLPVLGPAVRGAGIRLDVDPRDVGTVLE